MANKKAWKEFKDIGLLWWINMILHTLEWAIFVVIDDDGGIVDVYPARTKNRGFTEEDNTEGYIKVSKYLDKESKELSIEARLS